MSGNNDLELNLSPIKKPTASRGRRANNSATKQGTLCLLCQRNTPKNLTNIWQHFEYQVDVVNSKDMQEIEMKQTLYELLVK